MPVGPYDSFDECVADNGDKDDPAAFCAYLEEQTARRQTDAGFTGAVVSLLPSPENAAAMAVDGGEDPEVLHLTLAWLGDTDGDPTPALPFADAVAAVADAVRGVEPVTAEAFAAAVFNPADAEREPATVLLYQADALPEARDAVVAAVGDASDFPVWFPHVTVGYDVALAGEQITDRMGPVTFDRVAVAYADDVVEIR